MTCSSGAWPGWPVRKMMRVAVLPSSSRITETSRKPASSVSITTSSSTTAMSLWLVITWRASMPEWALSSSMPRPL